MEFPIRIRGFPNEIRVFPMGQFQRHRNTHSWPPLVLGSPPGSQPRSFANQMYLLCASPQEETIARA